MWYKVKYFTNNSMFTLSLYIIKQIINHHQTNIRKQTKNTTEIETETNTETEKNLFVIMLWDLNLAIPSAQKSNFCF